MFGNVRLAFRTILENFRKSSESGRKSSENHQKRRHQYVYIIKRTFHVSSKIWILCSRGKNNISLFRYCSCHSNIKFISSRHRVISSIYAPYNPVIKIPYTCYCDVIMISSVMVSIVLKSDIGRFLPKNDTTSGSLFVILRQLNRGILVYSICLISISNSVSDGATNISLLNIERS